MSKRSAAVAKEVEQQIEKPKAVKEEVAKGEKKKRTSTSTKFAPSHVVTLLVDHNPKRAGSASFNRFENYEDEMTVEEALKAGVTAGDLAWDVEHNFIEIDEEFNEKAVKKSKAAPKPKPKAEKPAKEKVKAKAKKVKDEDEDEDAE